MSGATEQASKAPVVLRRMGPIATVVINQPGAHNVIDAKVRSGLLRAAAELADDAETRVVVLSGAGEETFSAGFDIAEIALLSPREAERLALQAQQVFDAFALLDKPVVAAIKGSCIGAGFELALYCDIRIARVDARFALPGVSVGLVPGGGALGRLTRIIGAGPARALCLTGAAFSAERAFMLGLVANVAAHDEFDIVTSEITAHLASLPPVATRELKALLNAAERGGVAAAAELGPRALQRCYAEGEAGERLRAFFHGSDPEATLH